jgi:hypothetical protein
LGDRETMQTIAVEKHTVIEPVIVSMPVAVPELA